MVDNSSGRKKWQTEQMLQNKKSNPFNWCGEWVALQLKIKPDDAVLYAASDFTVFELADSDLEEPEGVVSAFLAFS